MASQGDYAAIAHARVKERWTRMAVAAAVAAVAYSVAPSPWPLVWLLAVGVAQIPDLLAFGPLARGQVVLTPKRRLFCIAAAGLSTGVYSCIAGYLWQSGGVAGPVIATVFLAGALMHVGLHLHHARGVLAATTAPFLIHWFALPLISIEALGTGAVIAIEAAGILYVAHLCVAVRHAWLNTQAIHAANRAKSTFLATVSHEIRTPLNGILGMAQAMGGDALSPAQAARLDVIRQSGQALVTLLNDVLDMSKIEAGKIELELVEFDLSPPVTEAWHAFSGAAEAKGLTLALAIAPDAEGVYLGDPTRLRQIVYNLLSNAVKFTERGGVEIEVSRQGDSVTIAVTDTGPGLAQAQLKNLFQRFSQGDLSRTRTHGGTGLGLAICRELARLMGGEVQATSSPGEGSTFSLTVPLERVGEVVASEPEPVAVGAPLPRADALRVLAAEDNRVNQIVLRTLLEQAGVDATIVEDGLDAVEAWRTGEWDVVLLDVQMPRMDGPAAAGVIRAEEARSGRRRTPIIALTADVMTHQLAEYRRAGMDACVAKPIEVQHLFAALSQVLEKEDGAEERAVPRAVSAG